MGYSGCQAQCEPRAHPHCKQGKPHTGLRSLGRTQQHISEAAHRILHHVLGCRAQKRLEHMREGPANSCCPEGHGLQHVPCKKKLKEPGLFYLTKRRSRADLTAACNHLKESKTREQIIFLQQLQRVQKGPMVTNHNLEVLKWSRGMKHCNMLLRIVMKCP